MTKRALWRSFLNWLACQRDRDDPVGDFSRDWFADWSRDSDRDPDAKPIRSHDQMFEYLNDRDVSAKVMAAVARAVREWTKDLAYEAEHHGGQP